MSEEQAPRSNTTDPSVVTPRQELREQQEREGYRAGVDGRYALDCPYPAGSEAAIAWLVGWAKS